MKSKSRITLLAGIIAILGLASCHNRVVVVDRPHHHWHNTTPQEREQQHHQEKH